MQAGGRRFDPVRLHHSDDRCQVTVVSWGGGTRRGYLIRILSFGQSVEDGRQGDWQLSPDNCHLFDIVDRKSARACFGCPLRLWLVVAGWALRRSKTGSYEVLKSLTFGLTRGSWVCVGVLPLCATGFVGIKRLKGIWWMPWHQEAMKDVARCEKPRGAVSKL